MEKGDKEDKEAAKDLFDRLDAGESVGVEEVNMLFAGVDKKRQKK